MKRYLNSLYRPAYFLLAAAAFLGGSATLYGSEAVPLKNPTFQDLDGNGEPDDWKGYPGGDGIQVDDSGVWIKDSSTSKGLGIQQWVPVTAGNRYTATVEASGEGGLFLYMTFIDQIPSKAAHTGDKALKQKRIWTKGGGAETNTTTLTEIAPAGSEWVQIWIYSPNSGTTNIRIESISLKGEAVAPVPVAASSSDGVGVTSESGSGVSIKNSSFEDRDGDGKPDEWDSYPGGEGIQVDESGVWIKDSSPSKGLGIKQWVPVTAGNRYTATVEASGNGGLFLYMTFIDKIPAKSSQIEKKALKQKRIWTKGGGSENNTTTLTETAPAGAEWVQLWIYSPNSGTTDIRIEDISLSEEALASSAPAATSVAPSINGEPVFTSAGDLVKNPYFKEIGSDGIPVGWEYYPEPNGSGTRITKVENGLHLVDSDKKNGVGISQWVPVQPGKRYVFEASVQGDRGLFLYVEYATEKPDRKSLYSKVKISSKREWVKDGKIAKVSSVAPASATWARIWLYSASSGICDVIVNSITGGEEDLAEDAVAVAAGLFGWMNFETGDFSQASSREGAAREIVSKETGPVREGNYAYRAMLKHGKERTEVVGPRSPAYGVARYAWSIFVPENFDGDTFFTIVTQWHDWGTGREYPKDGGAPTHLYIAKDEWRVKLRHQGEGHTTASEQFNLGSIDGDRGKWTDWVMEVNWQAPGDGGWMKFYKNGELVIDHKGTTWYEGKEKGPFFKMGLYRGYGGWPGTEEESILVFDSFRMALGEDSTYEQ
ncbi:MAG: polysaccharide lyase, partial [Puniceicoccales bacterium]